MKIKTVEQLNTRLASVEISISECKVAAIKTKSLATDNLWQEALDLCALITESVTAIEDAARKQIASN